jgi:hypothetical protein
MFSVIVAASAAIVFSGVQPHLASQADRVFLTFGQGSVISVVQSVDGGETFGRPTQITVDGKVSLGMRRGPRIAATTRAVLVAVVAGAKGGGADGDVLLYRSTNGGGAFGAPVIINDVPGAAREGLHALAAGPNCLVVIAWLDLRDKGTRIYAAVSRDHGATWSPDALVYASASGSVCECCHPSLAIGADGRIAVMFRNNVDGNRDMYVAQSRDGVTFSAVEKQGANSWTINACPMDGGAIAIDGGDVVSIWRREDTVYLTTRATPEQRIGTGRDPVVAQAGSRRDIAWSTSAGVVLLRGSAAPIPIGPGRFPSIISFERRTIVAWEDQGSIRVVTVPR